MPNSLIAAFTICSNNYLPQAITLAESLRRHEPDWLFYIGLVDVLTPIPGIKIPDWVDVVEVDRIGVKDLREMANRYSIVELCTSVKPTYFRYIFSKQADVDKVLYLDPDTSVFNSCQAIEVALAKASVVLTPHHYTPIPLDGQFPAENLALNHGVYNLGFLGLRRGPTSNKLLDWWEERMREHCRIDLKEGWFVDQLFFNYVPIYFNDVHVLRHPGVNVAYWNYHERRIQDNATVEFAGRHWPLILYHFSGFSPKQPERPTRVEVRLDVQKNPGLKRLLSEYADGLVKNGYNSANHIQGMYATLYREQVAATNVAIGRLYQRARSRVSAVLRGRLGGPKAK